MDDTEVAVSRPRRWDSPLDPRMRTVDVEHLLKVEPFASIDPTIFPARLPLDELLRNDARIVRYRPGDLVVREGDYGHSAFMVLRGRLRILVDRLPPEALGRQGAQKQGWLAAIAQIATRSRWPEVRQRGAVEATTRPQSVFLQDIPRILETTKTVVLEEGEFFGELAALTRSQRTATVIAETESVLVELRWQGLRDLMQRTPALEAHIEKLYRTNSLRVHLRATPLLASLPAEHLSAVADATRFRSHGDFDWHDDYEPTLRGRRGDAVGREPLIAEEEAPLDGILLVRSGFARRSCRYGHGHRTLSYLGKGQAFGLAEAVETYRTGKPTPLDASLRALGYVDVLEIPQSALDEWVFPHLGADELAQAAGRPAATANAGPLAAETGIDQGLLEFLVERRLMNGQQAMAIDLDRCTRCDDCVRACAATHNNNPRFVRQGDRYGPVQIVHACMHCVDPVCMIGCPTGAIGRDSETGVVRINDQTCIGCGTCAESCPYDNIRMVEIRNPRGALLVDQQSGQPLVQAAKCDLCVDLPGGPACQSACPHDALVRIDLGNLDDLSRWRDR